MSTNANSVQIDNKNITISPAGLLLRNGTRRVDPFVDKESGALAFELPNVEAPNGLETRFVKVEVFRAFSQIPNIPKLDVDDVVCEDGNEKNPSFTNLKLSEKGMAKVYDQGSSGKVQGPGVDDNPVDDTTADGDGEPNPDSPPGDSPVEDKVNEEPVASDTPVDTSEEEVEELKNQDGDSISGDEEVPNEAPVEEVAGDAEVATPPAEAEAPSTDSPQGGSVPTDDSVEPEQDLSNAVIARKGNGSFYSVEDHEGNALNDGKQINGKKNLEEFAADAGKELVIAD